MCIQETQPGRIHSNQCQLQHFLDINVTFVAKEFSPFTTSNKAVGEDDPSNDQVHLRTGLFSGMIEPYVLAECGSQKTKHWTTETCAYLEEIII